jgi:hypothetical protein
MPIPDRIASNTRFTPWFDDCIGAIDGTHVAAFVPASARPRYRNRKGGLSQNVLAACHFDGQFSFLLPGWEGSAHDSRVLSDAEFQHGFITPPGKFWLGDAGYSNSETLLVPYRGIRYHLREQHLADQR